MEGLKWQKVENGTKRASAAAAAARTDHRIRKSARPLLLALVSLRRGGGPEMTDRERDGEAPRKIAAAFRFRLSFLKGECRGDGESREDDHTSTAAADPPSSFSRLTNEAQAAAAAKLKFSRLSLFCGSENYTSRQDATRRHSCWSNKIGGCSGKAPWQSLWEHSKPRTPAQSYMIKG